MRHWKLWIAALALLLALCACGQEPAAAPDNAPAPDANAPAVTDQQKEEEPGATAQDTAGAAPADGEGSEDKETATEPGQDTQTPEQIPEQVQEPADAQPEPSAEQPEETKQPEETEKPDGTLAEQPEETPAEQPAPASEPETVSSEPVSASAADPKAAAEGLVGRPVSELYAAIGQPLSADYAPSCLEEGAEDGELAYSGFTVYTTRTANAETVYDVF